MDATSHRDQALPADLMQLIFDQMVGDTQTLATAGLVCRSWRALSLRSLLEDVDLSSHNRGRIQELEDLDLDSSLIFGDGPVMSDWSDHYRPANLVSRQRAFLRLVSDRRELALYVKRLAWTLIWVDFGEDPDSEDLAETNMKTWDVFECMQNVTNLDLASLHDIGNKQYIRQNPARLFPAVTHLRLVGWMHRGLVKAIVTSLDATKLTSLKLDHLQDEGALPDGTPMPENLATANAHERGNPYEDTGIDDDLWLRQEKGEAAIFPGSSWYPLRLLRQKTLSSLAHFQIDLGPLSGILDERNAITLAREIAKFIICAKDSLEVLSIRLGEPPALHATEHELRWTCGTSRMRIGMIGRPLAFDLTSAFLHQVLPALTEHEYPLLQKVDMKGFRILHGGKSRIIRPPNPDLTWQYIRDCPYVDEDVTRTPNLDYRDPFTGYDYELPEAYQDRMDELEEVLRNS